MSDSRRDDRPLRVEADLALEIDGAETRIVGHGELIVVEAPSIRAAGAILRSARAVPTGADPLARLGDGLERADLRVDVRVRGTSVARAGAGIDPGLVSRALGSRGRRVGPPVRVSVGGVALAALRGR